MTRRDIEVEFLKTASLDLIPLHNLIKMFPALKDKPFLFILQITKCHYYQFN